MRNYDENVANGTVSLSEIPARNIVKNLIVDRAKTKPDLLNNLIPTVLLDNQPIKLVEYQGRYFPYNCLKMLYIQTDKDGKPTHGVVLFVGANGRMRVSSNNGKEVNELVELTAQGKADKLLKPNKIYFVALIIEQKEGWDQLHRSKIGLENVVSTATAYDQTVNKTLSTDGSIVLTTELLIEN
ncbi:MAG: hypothetical protein AB9907_07770 [Flexilinea sp.]